MPKQTLREVLAEAVADPEYAAKYKSLRSVAAVMDVGVSTVYDYMEGIKKRPRPETLRAFATAFPRYAPAFYEAVGEELPPSLAACPPYCEKANRIAEALGVSKEEAILRAVDRFADELSVSA